jgi:hypothetical protein
MLFDILILFTKIRLIGVIYGLAIRDLKIFLCFFVALSFVSLCDRMIYVIFAADFWRFLAHFDAPLAPFDDHLAHFGCSLAPSGAL